MARPHASISLTEVPGLDQAKRGRYIHWEGLQGEQHWERETRGRNRAPVLLLRQDDNIYFYPFFFKENIIPRKLMWIRGKVSGLALQGTS